MLMYALLYRLGVTPWERYGAATAASFEALLDREEAERRRPLGRALELGWWPRPADPRARDMGLGGRGHRQHPARRRGGDPTWRRRRCLRGGRRDRAPEDRPGYVLPDQRVHPAGGRRAVGGGPLNGAAHLPGGRAGRAGCVGRRGTPAGPASRRRRPGSPSPTRSAISGPDRPCSDSKHDPRQLSHPRRLRLRPRPPFRLRPVLPRTATTRTRKIGYVPPVEYEAAYYREIQPDSSRCRKN